MKGYAVVIIPVEVPDDYAPKGVLPREFEADVATLLDVAIMQRRDPSFTFGDAEVWTLSAFTENGGRLTQDHSEDQLTYHNDEGEF